MEKIHSIAVLFLLCGVSIHLITLYRDVKIKQKKLEDEIRKKKILINRYGNIIDAYNKQNNTKIPISKYTKEIIDFLDINSATMTSEKGKILYLPTLFEVVDLAKRINERAFK